MARKERQKRAERLANENLRVAATAEKGPVTAEQRIASSEAVVANRADLKAFKRKTSKKAIKKPAKKTKKATKKSPKKAKK